MFTELSSLQTFRGGYVREEAGCEAGCWVWQTAFFKFRILDLTCSLVFVNRIHESMLIVDRLVVVAIKCCKRASFALVSCVCWL